jgi:hypothetical protein
LLQWPLLVPPSFRGDKRIRHRQTGLAHDQQKWTPVERQSLQQETTVF